MCAIIASMAVRKVVQAGHPALKTKNKEITDFSSPLFKKLIKDLKDTMYKTDLVGIAAPQIAENYAVFITHPRQTVHRKVVNVDELRVYINPKITSHSKKRSIVFEGCGSVISANLFGPVSRPNKIRIEAFGEKGNRFSLVADGLLARVIQHELDHLTGMEFVQKVSDYSKIFDKKYYYKNIRNSKEQRGASRITKIEYKKL